MAMCLQYLNSIGRIKVNIPHISAVDDAISYRNIMTDNLTKNYNSNPTDYNIRQVMNSFCEKYCSPKISTKGDGFWGDLVFSTIIEEININCPFVMMFNANRIPDINYNARHATTCVGYRTNNSDNYTIVRVPLVNGSGTVPLKEILWNGTNVHGYYLVYIW